MPRTKPKPRPPKFPPLTQEQRKWIECRDEVGSALDFYLFTYPAPEMRVVVRDLEDCLAQGDHAVGLLQPNGDKAR